MIDIYYTPIISTFEEDKKFYLNIVYPSNTIKLQMSLPDFRYGKSYSIIYLTEEIELFIKNLYENINSKIHTIKPFDLKIILDDDHINIIHEEVNMNIKIKNTECSRDQLADTMLKYLDFITFYDPDL